LADKIICVSNGIKADLNSLGIDEKKLVVLNNPVDLVYIQGRSNAPPPHSWMINKTEPILLGIGRLTEQKGFDVLLRALAIVQRTLPTKLIILGEGPLKKHLRNLSSQLGIKEKVDFPGYVDNPYAYIKNSDVFVLSSRWEGFVNVILESLTLGTQVVATDCWSSPREMLLDGELGHLTPINDPVSMADAIVDALQNPITPGALQKRARDFCLSKIVAQYAYVLETVGQFAEDEQ
jgi:glycosyltransferase involved in cell wall biosynthesis